MNRFIVHLLAMLVLAFAFTAPAQAKTFEYDFNTGKFNLYGPVDPFTRKPMYSTGGTTIVAPPGQFSPPVNQGAAGDWSNYNPNPGYKPSGKVETGWTQYVQPAAQHEVNWAGSKVTLRQEVGWGGHQAAPRYQTTYQSPGQPAYTSIMRRSSSRGSGGNSYQTGQRQSSGQMYVPGQNSGVNSQGSGGYNYDNSGAATYSY